jgi:hypothetical protein
VTRVIPSDVGRALRVVVLGFSLLLPRIARADVSSWLLVAPGSSWTRERTEAWHQQTALELDFGLGSPPDGTLVFGGLFHWQTHFGRGSDVGLLFRTTHHGFVNGGWGAALDLGGYQRWWESGSTGYMGQLVLGAPWGITLAGGAGHGTNDQTHVSVVLGIDLARLTVYRRTGTSWWKNPFPAVRPDDSE